MVRASWAPSGGGSATYAMSACSAVPVGRLAWRETLSDACGCACVARPSGRDWRLSPGCTDGTSNSPTGGYAGAASRPSSTFCVSTKATTRPMPPSAWPSRKRSCVLESNPISLGRRAACAQLPWRRSRYQSPCGAGRIGSREKGRGAPSSGASERREREKGDCAPGSCRYGTTKYGSSEGGRVATALMRRAKVGSIEGSSSDGGGGQSSLRLESGGRLAAVTTRPTACGGS
mmetsp:Transcript_3480/g.9190  ORF Transcript_3480/g.9190 Transcript_3480/m.9190 type:complete len:232 (+) Transcript_3480:210-905(+)